MSNLPSLSVSPDTAVRDVMASIDRNAKGMVVVLNSGGELVGIVTDGDLRRAVLARIDLGCPVSDLLVQKNAGPAVTVPEGTSTEMILELMRKRSIRHIPVIDARNRVLDVAVLDDIVKEYELPLTAVVFAGGRGSRLMPLTREVPKPMLPVGGRPILEHTVRQLQHAGVRRINLTTHYRQDVIESHFGDGRAFGLEIEYLSEDTPLGTAGALSRLSDTGGPLLVINGDILTAVDYKALLAYHVDHHSDLTVAVREEHTQTPYGVVQTRGADVIRIVEKPVVVQFINAGIYLLNRDVCSLIPKDECYDMPNLINQLIADGRRVVSFPIREYWRDIGKPDDYAAAVKEIAGGALDRQ